MSTADNDDEKTVPGPAAAGRSRRGSDADVDPGVQAERLRGRATAAGLQPGHTLPLGARLRDYEITGLIGEGGFGIVYLAWDHSLQRRVAIKEYMPASMAARAGGSAAIVVKSGRHLDTFRAGLKSFVNEARLLARFDHPSLVKVYRFWEENGTAYMVMPYYEGPTLKAALAELAAAPGEAELRAWLRPLLDALDVMHRAQCYHRDIAPDNILLTPRGPLLLDFGAARRVIGDMTHAITVVLKPGYAPIEQYGDVATMTQGAWTDLYALASVVYYAITGRTPPSSVERLMEDRLAPLSASAAGRYSDALLGAVDAALAVRPADRPQNVARFRALLDRDLPPGSPPASDSGWSSGWGTVPGTLPDPVAPDLPTQVLARRKATLPASNAGEEKVARPASTDGARAPVPARERTRTASPKVGGGRRLVVALAIAVVVVALAFVGWLQPRSTGPSVARIAASAPSTTVPMPMPMPASAPTPTPNPQAATPRVAEPAVVSPAPIAPPATEPALGSTAPATPSVVEPAVGSAAPTAPPIVESRPAEADPAPAGSASAAAQRTSRPRRETTAPRSESTTAPTRAPQSPAAVSSRCSDILQKASLEPLTTSEAEYLKRECR